MAEISRPTPNTKHEITPRAAVIKGEAFNLVSVWLDAEDRAAHIDAKVFREGTKFERILAPSDFNTPDLAKVLSEITQEAALNKNSPEIDY